MSSYFKDLIFDGKSVDERQVSSLFMRYCSNNFPFYRRNQIDKITPVLIAELRKISPEQGLKCQELMEKKAKDEGRS